MADYVDNSMSNDYDDHESSSEDSEDDTYKNQDGLLQDRMQNFVKGIFAETPDEDYQVRIQAPAGDVQEDEAFCRKHEAILEGLVGDRNILHLIIDEANEKNSNAQHAMTAISGHLPHLLDEHPSESRTNKQGPLYCAVVKKKSSMVKAMIDGLHKARGKDPERIPSIKERMLSRQVEGYTCLHLAITSGLEEEAIQALISASTEKVLSVKDNDGLTPLHHIVGGRKWHRTKRLETVRMMVEKAGSTLAAEADPRPSVFQHHVKIWENLKARIEKENKLADDNLLNSQQKSRENPKQSSARANPGKGANRSSESNDSSTTVLRKDPKRQQNNIREGESRLEMSKEDDCWSEARKDGVFRVAETGVTSSGKDHSEETFDEANHANRSARRKSVAFVSRPASRTPSQRLTGVPGGQCSRSPSPGGQHNTGRQNNGNENDQKSNEKEKERAKEKEREKLAQDKKSERALAIGVPKKTSKRHSIDALNKWSDDVQLTIKLHCMRFQSPQETSRILYGNNPKGKCLRDLQ